MSKQICNRCGDIYDRSFCLRCKRQRQSLRKSGITPSSIPTHMRVGVKLVNQGRQIAYNGGW